jgi:tripartite motif-containing protein 71
MDDESLSRRPPGWVCGSAPYDGGSPFVVGGMAMVKGRVLCGARSVCVVVACVFVVGVLVGEHVSGVAADQFASYGVGAGEFIEPFGLAVDRSDGDVYVLDTNNYRLEKFTGEGRFIVMWGWGVADGRRHLETCARSCQPGLRGPGAGEFDFPEGVAVDDDPMSRSYRDVYIPDLFNHRVQEFTPAGRFVMMFGAGVNVTAHLRHEAASEDTCPVHAGDRCGAGVGGGDGGMLEFPVEGHFIDVGPDGTIYVGERNRVQKFSSGGAYLGQITLDMRTASEPGESGGVSGLSVNAAGDLFVIRVGVKGVVEYDPAGRPLQVLDEQREPENAEGPVPVVALDSLGDVFIDYNARGEHRIDEFDPTGAKIAAFDEGAQGGLHGIAVNQASSALYVLDTNENTATVRIVPVPPRRPFAAAGSELALWLIPGL